MRANGVSVVIPVLDEAEQLTLNLPAVLRGHPSEVIVVDGGSTDRSREIARSFGATVLRAEQGRGRQLNAGARAARGTVDRYGRRGGGGASNSRLMKVNGLFLF